MHANTMLRSSQRSKQLWLKVRTPYGAERLLHFDADSDRVRLVGSASGVDVHVPTGFPVHCYFEREDDAIFLVVALQGATVSINNEVVTHRAPIQGMCSVVLGGLRLEVELCDSLVLKPKPIISATV
jgi:hypothetical protein